jgi:RimJ/RimL family protein N-acetyltransferase
MRQFALALTATQIKTSERNVASQRVAERAKFVREAVLEDTSLEVRDGSA